MEKELRAAARHAQETPPEVPLDTDDMATAYTNWYRVTGTPEEMIIEFGLTPELGQRPSQPVKVTQRLVMNFYTAKRLLAHLHYAVQKHEGYFGSLEMDINRRVRQSE
jgi:hypothetical protein